MSYLRVVTNGTTGAGNGVPTLATHGVPIRRGGSGLAPDEGMPSDLDNITILVEGVGGAAATNTIGYVKLWGYASRAVGASSGGKWFPMGTAAADADRGKLNAGAALGEVIADRINFAELINGLADFERIYAEYGALTNVTRVDITLISAGLTRPS